jgi:hypothetical protein
MDVDTESELCEKIYHVPFFHTVCNLCEPSYVTCISPCLLLLI